MPGHSKTTSVLKDDELAKVLSVIYHKAGGFGGAASLHQKLPKGSASLARVKAWLATQQVGAYLQSKPPPVVYARFTEQRPNRIHQADVLFLPHDKVGSKTYKYALTLVDVASRYKAARPLADKSAAAVASALANIYAEKGTPLEWPHTMMVDQGGEFKSDTQKLLDKHGVNVRRADKGHHRSQAFVESFNKVLGQRLFRGMYAKGFDDGKPSNAWVKALPEVVADMNATTTRLTGLAPAKAIQMARVPLLTRTVEMADPIAVGTMVHVVANEEAKDSDAKRRATDPWWTAKAYPVVKRIDAPGEPSLYYVAEQGSHGYTRSQLRVAAKSKTPPAAKSSPPATTPKASAKTKKPALVPRVPQTRAGRTTKPPSKLVG